jgi:hypothetical protein
VGNVSCLTQYIYLRKNSDPFVDEDNDGLDDQWERYTFGSIYFSDGSLDSNGSGLSDKDEYLSDRAAYEFSLDLSPGWNLVSIPCRLTEEVAQSLNDKITNVFYYDSENQYYKKFNFNQLLSSSTIDSVVGLWVFDDQELGESIKFKGLSPLLDIEQFGEGWSLFGYRRQRVAPNGTTLSMVYKWYGDDYFELDATDSLFPLKGYWIESTESE